MAMFGILLIFGLMTLNHILDEQRDTREYEEWLARKEQAKAKDREAKEKGKNSRYNFHMEKIIIEE